MLTLKRLGLLALVIGFAQVVFGAVVRITGSGLGCGDHWPDCYGSLTPPQGAPTLLVEISHRYGAIALSLAVLALGIAAFLRRNDAGVSGQSGVLRPAVAAVILVVLAALFGAVTVKMALEPAVVVTHLAIAMALLAVLVVIVVRADGFAGSRSTVRAERSFRAGGAAVSLTLLTLIVGALTANTPGAAAACQGFPWCRSIAQAGPPLTIQITHRVLAVLLLGHLIGVFAATRKRAESRPLKAAAAFALGLVVLQIVIAAAMVEMHLPSTLRSLHQAVGTALWISVVAFTALAAGRGSSAPLSEIVRESPSRGEFATPEGVST